MGPYLFLVLSACFSCCVIRNLNAESLKGKTSEEDGSAAFLLGSLFGFRPCMDESCSSPSIPDESKVPPSSTPDEEYEPQHPDVTSPTPDHLVEHCLLLHTGTLESISYMDKRHPSIKAVKMKVIEDLIRYVSDFSVFGIENCGSEMAMLDFIRLAADALKKDYAEIYKGGRDCTFTLGVEETEEFPDKGTSESTSTEKSVVERSTSPTYVSTENSSKPPCIQTSEKPHATASSVTTEPCCAGTSGCESPEEIIAESDENGYDTPVLVGSIKGVPGVHYPNYTDVPITSFSCADKKYIPGFYADLETGCQIFHVCFEHRRESFLCPVGTIFNQPILACDYWYSSNCSLAQEYYEVNAITDEAVDEDMNVAVEQVISVLLEDKDETKVDHIPKTQEEIDITKFLPVKAKVTEFTKPVIEGLESVTMKPEVQEVDEVASQIFNKIVSSATDVVSKTRDVVAEVPEPGKIVLKPLPPISELQILSKLKPMLVAQKIADAKLAAASAAMKVAAVKTKVPIATKVKLAAAVPAVKLVAAKKAVPIAAKAALAAAIPAAKIAVVKGAVPIAGKSKVIAAAVPVAKVAAAKAVVPIATKTKIIGATVPAKKVASKVVVAGISKAKMAAAVPKLSIPILKTKVLAPPISAKTNIVIPVLKGKGLKTAAAPVLKVKKLPFLKSTLAGSTPVVKAKLIKTAAISPLTKKTLALGYLKLLKAKKLALMG